jgi:hypothetical protein
VAAKYRRAQERDGVLYRLDTAQPPESARICELKDPSRDERVLLYDVDEFVHVYIAPRETSEKLRCAQRRLQSLQGRDGALTETVHSHSSDRAADCFIRVMHAGKHGETIYRTRPHESIARPAPFPVFAGFVKSP